MSEGNTFIDGVLGVAQVTCTCNSVPCVCVSNSVKAEAVETVAAPTAALIESERLDLLRRVAACWPRFVTYHEGENRIEYHGTMDPDGYGRCIQGRYLDLSNDAAAGFMIVHMLSEIELQGYVWTLDNNCDRAKYEIELSPRANGIAFAKDQTLVATVARAFVAVMEAVKG